MLNNIKKYTNIWLLLTLIITFSVIVGSQSAFFLTSNNIINILEKSSLNLIIAVGMTYIICAGGIDLSLGANMALTGFIMASLLKMSVHPVAVIMAGIAFGTFLGACNGAVITRFKLNPFIVTLSTMSIFRGATILLSKGQPIFGFPSLYVKLGAGKLGLLSMPIVAAYTLALIFGVILSKTAFGNYIYAHGSNPDALQKMGVNKNRIQLKAYAIGGLMAGIASIIITSRLNTAEPLAAMNIEMEAIAIAVLGGIDIKGGRGYMIGTVLSCILLSMISNGLTIMDISSNYQQLLSGIIILLTVIISERKK